MPRFAGLDGLRALAVILVIVYHLVPGTLVGGYLGVDIFFVISGFLITSLLLRERENTGRIHLGSFWKRRARRLLPALATVVLVCSSAALLVGGDVLVGLGQQVLGASTFSYNWLAIGAGSSYFDETTPELFRNLWSLAVEEQFYLVWPLVILVLTLPFARRARAWIIGAIAATSAVWMIVLFSIGTGSTGADSTRVYYGTDTHSFGLAIGALLALLPRFRLDAARFWSRQARAGLALAGTVAFFALIAIAAFMPTDSPVVYRGGLLVVALLTAVVISASTAPDATLGKVLDAAPFRWVGARSYGLYLWHWPVFVLASAALPAMVSAESDRWITAGIALAITVLAAWFSYRFIETPIRRDGFRAIAGRFGRAWRGSRPSIVRVATATAAAVAAIALTASAISIAPRVGAAEAAIEVGKAAIEQPTSQVAEPIALPGGDQITAIGDSVMLASAPTLTEDFPGIHIDAVVSRQMKDLPDLVAKLIADGELRPTLLVGLGTNGPIDASTLDEVLGLVGPTTQVVLVNVQAPRDWTVGVNRTLTAVARQNRNVELANWRDAISPRLDLLSPDRIHPGGPIGGGIYTGAVRDALQRLAELPPLLNNNDYGLSPRPV